jgi:tRNA pseudouridine55 synthase
MDGIFNLWKPPGMTSHDVVAIVRRLTGQRRVGHAGTLDPMAEGVLVVGIGQGTRLLEYLVGGTKEYCARIHLGVSTDTDDAEGAVLALTGVKAFRRPTIERGLQVFTGRQEQLPPTYSALKTKGQTAYRLARAGKVVERTARPVMIESIELVHWQRPHIVCHVTCSKGTYIRSLARDVGEYLGCGAHLCGLIRLRSGAFTLEDAAPLPLLEHALAAGYWQQIIYPLDFAVRDRPAVIVGADNEARLRQGQDIGLAGQPAPDASGQHPWRAYSVNGELIALLARSVGDGSWHAHKVFPISDEPLGAKAKGCTVWQQ